ncbi:hypothetical protein F8O01_09270 [Pseudoclavibacter chungangensis]|uniref:site-specific DNA-methyltransferase (adenine-specific) n=1 Tax=Pseudoclavibacter chungangensis TaxID=587635 RepID=A0A7J5BRB6_9MICO|nr:type I restriction-modification system subunit M N-terminal domain-containing protein [Pseudoclavibacter chungangensis]KAB1656833.1 hypothetical protein F8O01_09270 [Pseudoclavibacter chungangensis]NYJ67289.1 type I restriction-modification system DNA methylase subunit [Pseudoclavibacter chungangensis]
MAPTTEEAQRAELHKTTWRIANDLRGSVDGWDFTTYVLGMLFSRFISANFAACIEDAEQRAGAADFTYARKPDSEAEFGRADTVAEKSFFTLLPSELFDNARTRAPRDANLNERLERVFKHIEGSAIGAEGEDDLTGLLDDLDVNSSRLGDTVAKRNEKLVKLLDAIGDLPPGDFGDNAIDLFGDAYEYVDASSWFTRVGNTNKLMPEDQQHILDAFTDRQAVEHVAALVSNERIGANEDNIAVSSNVEQEVTREVIDIRAQNTEIARIVAHQAELRTSIDAIVADREGGRP